MSRSNRPRRSKSHKDADDFDDDYDFEGASTARQEKLRLLIHDLIGRWHWIALGLILGVLGGLYYLSKAPRMYSSTASILVKDRTAAVLSSKEQADEIDLKSVEALNTVSARLKRPELLQKVASRPDIQELPGLIPPRAQWHPDWMDPWMAQIATDGPVVDTPAEVGGEIGKWATVAVRRNTRLVDITVRHPSPSVAMKLADAIVQEFQAESTQDRSEGRSSSIDILMKESDAARKRLQAAQNALANYQRAITTQKELEAKETTAAELRRRYLPKHPKMLAADNDVKAFEQRFLSEFEAARKSPADGEYWDQNDEELRKVENGSNAHLQTARRLLLARSAVLESEIAGQTEMFNSILKRMRESDINQQSNESETRVNSYAQLPAFPSSPKKPVILAGASMIGLFFGAFIALLLIRLDNKLHTVAQAELETGLPVLAAIPELPPKALEEISRKKRTPEPDDENVKNWDPRLLFRGGVSSTTFAESFRVLRASVSLLGDEKQRKITLFSSALPGEGKTFVSGNFALAAAQQGRKVLLVDLDLRKPALHKLFGRKRDSHGSGSTEVLSGQSSFDEALVTDTGEPNLHLILAGKRAPNPGELLAAGRVKEFLEHATERYDVVVIDSAPLLPVPDTRILTPLIDNLCLVTRAEYVPKAAVRRVVSLLEGDGEVPAGIIFNSYQERKRLIGQNYSYGSYQTSRYGRAYRYGYGTYGAYGSDDEE